MFLVLLVVMFTTFAINADAQGLTALARVDPDRSQAVDRWGGVDIQIGLSQPVPYRVYTLEAPWRLVVDFSVVDWDGLDPDHFDQSDRITNLRAGAVRADWSRIVLGLDGPMAVTSAELVTQGRSHLALRLDPVDADAFAALSGPSVSSIFALPTPAETALPRGRPDGVRPVVVMLDPGHGGIDPGAQRQGVVEAHLMLTFARELRDVLLRAGGFDVVMTRDSDVFVPLEMRLSLARAAGADVFLSLHADALAEGRAQGATIYTLSPEASDLASEKLAERHDRADILAGVDLTGQDDVIAGVLMDLARVETTRRSDRLADALVAGLRENIGNLHKRPRLEASFSVLKAADIPSVLIELGFMSSARDLANLRMPEWRARAALGIRDALRRWAAEDAAEAELLRR